MWSFTTYKKVACRLLWIALLLSSVFCLGWADSWEGIRAAGEKVAAVSAQFVQEKHLPILAKPLESKGRLVFRRPDMLRWEYTTPVKSVLLVNGDSVRRFVQTDAGMTEDASVHLKAMQFVMPEIGGWLSGRFADNPLFEAELTGAGTIRLTPRDEGMARFIERIEIQFAGQPGVIDQVLIVEGPNAYTRMRFIESQVNPVLPDRLFEEVQ